jgi:hypothetical protein
MVVPTIPFEIAPLAQPLGLEKNLWRASAYQVARVDKLRKEWL